MRQEQPRLKIDNLAGVIVVEFVDKKILDEVIIGQIGEKLNTLVAQNTNPRFVLDFTKVAHLSSSALGMLITLYKRIREKQGQLRLCNVQPAIREVFEITRLTQVFQISLSRDEALAGIS